MPRSIRLMAWAGRNKELTMRKHLVYGLFGLVLASPACAQEYYNGAPAYGPGYGSPEEVTITAPRHHPQRSDIGAPIEDVALSRQVRVDDLDLRSHWGVRILRDRIQTTAHLLCDRLEAFYPATTGDSPSCYRAAVADAMEQADFVIARARANGGYANDVP